MVLVKNLEAKLFSRPVWLIVLLGLILDLSGTWLLPLTDRDEPRFAEASAEMLERHDWVVPTFNGDPRYDKPPLIYWEEIVCYECLGKSDLTARLPSALFATGTALLIFFWARRLTQPRTALVAALIFTTCFQVLVHARLAVADMSMIFFVCAALWSGWELTRPAAASTWGWWWMFYVSLALGFLAKGPVAWLPLGGLMLGRWRHPEAFVFPPGRQALGMAVTLGLVGLWGIPALLETHGDFATVGLGYHVVHRSFGVIDGHGAGSWLGWLASSPFTVATFFISFFPWAWWVPKALRNWWPTRREDVLGWYLLTQAALVFLVFTVVRTKLLHYTLPAFPCLAIWLARTEAAGFVTSLRVVKNFIIMSVVALVFMLGVAPAIHPEFVAYALFEKARPQLDPAMKMATVDFNEPSLVWEFRQVLTNKLEVLSPEQAVGFIHQKGPAILILPTKLYAANPGRWGTNLPVVQVSGMNFARFGKTELTAIIQR
jgi:4-amino-4-deoxy-L-arabinose transferase-like glycosyltransferase